MNHHRPSPLITIATVTYNAGRTLKPTLDSVAAQTYPHIEHLIVDGCSKDATMELIHRYVDENTDSPHPHDIRMTREPDRGLYDAMNKALAQATGHYIVFLNAGDRLSRPWQTSPWCLPNLSLCNLPFLYYCLKTNSSGCLLSLTVHGVCLRRWSSGLGLLACSLSL